MHRQNLTNNAYFAELNREHRLGEYVICAAEDTQEKFTPPGFGSDEFRKLQDKRENELYNKYCMVKVR